MWFADTVQNLVDNMEYTKLVLFLLISLPSPIIGTANVSHRRILPDLRSFKVQGIVGRFAVNRDALEREIQSRKQQDGVCGEDVKIQLPESSPHSSYNASYQSEVLVTYITITESTLVAELSDDVKEQVSTSYQMFAVLLPLVIGMTDERHVELILRHFSNSTKKITFPYGTNTHELIQVDSIEEADDGTVTIQLGGDVIVYQIQNDVKFKGQTKVTKDFDKVLGKYHRGTNYPLPFDWMCGLLGPQISFCELLDGFRCELARVGGDVCTVTTTTSSERSPATMKIFNMTGVFREMIPFLAETVPNESFEAELIDRQHSTGIVYPCLTP